MRKVSLALALLLPAAGHAAGARGVPAGFVGSVVPPYPAGTDSYEGSCVGPVTADLCAFSVGALSTVAREPVAVFAGKFHGRAPDGNNALWLVTDALPYPARAPRQGLRWATCLYKGAEDRAVMAVVEDKTSARSKAAGWAFRLDYETGKLMPIAPSDVECVSDEEQY